MPNKEKVRTFFKYTEADLQNALSDVQSKICGIREAGRKYNIPHSTILNKLNGVTPAVRKMGPKSFLSLEEEELIVRWVLSNAHKGIPLNKRTLCETVAEIIREDGRITPFKDSIPGEKWFTLFLKRHPELSQRHAESINVARALVTEQRIRNWHNELRQYLEEEQCLDIFEDPRRIFNSDESGFETNPKSGLVLGPKGMKNFYQVKSGSDKEQITVLFTISASGELYPPMLVLPYERIPSEVSRCTPPDWVFGRAKKGWMTSQTFHSYVCNTFLPKIKENGVKLPILYLVDGHKSHLTKNVSQFCADNGILLYALLPNATHILQPADVSLFRPLKINWKNTIINWKRQNYNSAVTKTVFPSLLKLAIENVSPETIQNGFRKCGIFPFDANAIDYAKCMTDTSRVLEPISQENNSFKAAAFDIRHLLHLESTMKAGRAKQFRAALSAGGEWSGDESAKELFLVWKKLRTKCKNEENDITGEKKTEDKENVCLNEKPMEDHDNNGKVFPGENTNSIELEAHKSLTSAIKPLSIHKTPEKHILVHQNIIIKSASPSHDLSASSSQNNVGVNNKISTAFLDHILWPEITPEKNSLGNKRTKERLPYAATSKRWLMYHDGKENIKKEKEEAKKQRAINRKRKQEEKKKKGQKRIKKIESDTESEEEWKASSSSDEISEDFEDIRRKGEFVLVAFPGKKKNYNYVCIIQNYYNEEEIEVQALAPLGEDKTSFRCIENDISMIDQTQILKVLPAAEIIRRGDRIKYKFLEPVLLAEFI